MDRKTRLEFERGIGIIEGASFSAPAGIQEALTVAVEIFEEAMKKTSVEAVAENSKST